MGFRFDLETVNWLAYLIQPDAPLPTLQNKWREKDALRKFLNRLSGRFYSARRVEGDFDDLAHKAHKLLASPEVGSEDRISAKLLKELRKFFGARPWIALLVPSCSDERLDSFLCSEDFMEWLVYHVRWQEPGLILQLEVPPKQSFDLTDVFPAFRKALAESTRWPGLLVWTPGGDSVFLSFPTTNICEVKKHASWILSHLAVSSGVDLEAFQADYWKHFPDMRISPSSLLHLLHLSDIHIGSKAANHRLPRVQQLIRNILTELHEESTVIPIVTGDILNSPNDKHLDQFRVFMDFLCNLDSENPVITLGNHDVRKEGFLAKNYKVATGLPRDPVIWYDAHKVGLVCFDSVKEGELARGSIGEKQFLDLGSEIDRKENSNDYTLIGLLHHHPVPVSNPNWLRVPFYQKWLGKLFERTVELRDSPEFCEFAIHRAMAAILHGHKHIPRVDKLGRRSNIPVFGCGSTVGKVLTKGRGTYMSINIVSIDNATGQLSGRLLVERIPGAGLVEEKRHERVFRKDMTSNH